MPAKKAVDQKPLRTQKWAAQDDVDVTENLAHPRLQAKDYALLVFCGWLSVLLGAICGYYVKDEFLGHLFFCLLWLVNLGLWRALGAEFLWSVFLARDRRRTMVKIALVAAVFCGACLVWWGAGVLCWTYSDVWVTGIYSNMWPVLDSTWKEVLYLTGLFLMMWVEGIFQTLWWNVLYDNCVPSSKAGLKWGMRFWAGLCGMCTMWCYADSQWKGTWWWTWLLAVALFKLVSNLTCFVLYEKISLGAAIAYRLGLYTAAYLLWLGVWFQWWGLDWTYLQFGWVKNNLWDL